MSTCLRRTLVVVGLSLSLSAVYFYVSADNVAAASGLCDCAGAAQVFNSSSQQIGGAEWDVKGYFATSNVECANICQVKANQEGEALCAAYSGAFYTTQWYWTYRPFGGSVQWGYLSQQYGC